MSATWPKQLPPTKVDTNNEARIQDDFMNIEDILNVEMDEKDNRTDQQPVSLLADSEVMPTRKIQTDVPFFGERFAYNMKVNNIIVQCGSKKCTSGPFSGTEDIIYSIASNWKGQAEALGLSPAVALEFYRKQYDQLCTVLSISLFNHPPESPSTSGTAKYEQGKADAAETVVKRTGVDGKRKRNTTTNNDCEYIIFEKNGKFVYRRVESAVKYAKRNKPSLDRYICILPKSEQFIEQTKNSLVKLRAFDSKFIVGSEIKFSGTYLELQKNLIERLAHISWDRFTTVQYVVGENSKEGIIESVKKPVKYSENSVTHRSSPPAKKQKIEGSKSIDKSNTQSVSETRNVNSSTIFGGEDARRSGIEDYTESESNSDSESIEEHALRQKSTCETASEHQKKEGRHDEVSKSVENQYSYRNPVVMDELEFERPPSPFLNKTADKNGSKEAKKKR